MRRVALALFVVASGLWWARADDAEPRVSEPPADLRRTLKLDPFYAKCVVRDGLAIVSSAKVEDAALVEAAYLVDRMLTGRDDLRRALVAVQVRVAVMAPTEFTTTIPEHRDLTPAAYWDKRARGLGATRVRPAVSCGAENLLLYPGDPYRGENILIHEFAHAIHQMALKSVDKTFEARLTAAYDQAMGEGLWKNTYAATNRSEYWAEGVQSWFDCNRAKDAQHNGIRTREALERHDPRLASLLAEAFPKNAWRYAPPRARKAPEPLAGREFSTTTFAWPSEILKAFEEHQAKKKRP